MTHPLNLSVGEHDLIGHVVNWNAALVGQYPQGVQLTASIELLPNQSSHSAQDSSATTLVIRMDSRVAKILLEKLSGLHRSTDWPQKEEDGNQV